MVMSKMIRKFLPKQRAPILLSKEKFIKNIKCLKKGSQQNRMATAKYKLQDDIVKQREAYPHTLQGG